MKKFLFLSIFILAVGIFSFAQGAEQHERIYSYPPNGIETTKEIIPLMSRLKKYFYFLSCTVTNNTQETLYLKIHNTGLTSDDMLTVFEKCEEKSRSKNELKEAVDGVKEYGSCIGSVPLAELGTIVYLGSLPSAFVKTVFKKKNLSKRDIELLSEEYSKIKELESQNVSEILLAPRQKIMLYGVYVLGCKGSPVIEINYNNGKKHFFKI